MLAKDFFDRCNEESKKIILSYLCFIYYSGHKDGVLSREVFFNNLDNTFGVVIFYFLYFNYLLNNDFKKICDKHEVNIGKYFDIPEAAYKRIDQALGNNFGKENIFSKEVVFNYHLISNSLLKTCCGENSIICVERIILNMIRCVNVLDTDIESAFKLSDIISDLEKIALQKENVQIVDNNKKDIIKLSYGEVLTDKKYDYNPLIGRDKEFRNMCALLMDNEKSLLIHGNPGVGKTSLVNGLAYRIQEENISLLLASKHIIQINGSELVSGCKYVGSLEERLLEIINYVINNKNMILFIDEIHTLIGLGQSSKSNNDVSNILKPYLGDGRLKIIGATTTEEYNNIITNGAFARRFNSLEVKQLSNEDILHILDEVIKRFKLTQNIDFKYRDEEKYNLLKLIIELSNRKNPNALLQKKLYNPDLAITILRNGYNFAMLDNKEALDIDSIIEGLSAIDYFKDNAIKEFQDKALALTRTKPTLSLIK